MTPATALARPLLLRERASLARARQAMTGRVALVMTMGALHEGHLSLVRLAAEQADHVLVSIFVNPLQFGPGEDLDAYPRRLQADLDACAQAGVDAVFAPTAEEVYPHGEPVVRVSAGALGERWEGASRPGHFDGVLTVVALVLNLTRPDVAVFGRKDRQQLTAVARMVDDLGMGVRLVAGETAREADGLARSSRNVYLTPDERARAVALPQALQAARSAAGAGADARQVREAAEAVLEQAPGVVPEYCALVEPASLEPVPDGHRGPAVLLLAARVGATRLIDNTDLAVAVAP